MPYKPDILKSLEQCEAFGALPETGGIEDQSYIWLQAVAVCRNIRAIHKALKERNKGQI